MAFAQHVYGLLLQAPHFVFQAVLFFVEVVETVVQGASANALARVVDGDGKAAVLEHYGQDALATHINTRNADAVDIACKTEHSVYYLARVDSGFPLCVGVDGKIEHVAVEHGHTAVARDIVLSGAGSESQQGE